MVDGNPDELNESESIKMIRYAIDHGVNVGRASHDMIRHERLTRIISRALQDGYRQRVKIAASSPLFFIDSSSDFDGYLNRQLQSAGVDGVDFYLLGWLNRDNWPRLRGTGRTALGSAGHYGWPNRKIWIPFMTIFRASRTILDDYDSWSLCQFQFSDGPGHYPGVGGIKFARRTGVWPLLPRNRLGAGG